MLCYIMLCYVMLLTLVLYGLKHYVIVIVIFISLIKAHVKCYINIKKESYLSVQREIVYEIPLSYVSSNTVYYVNCQI